MENEIPTLSFYGTAVKTYRGTRVAISIIKNENGKLSALLAIGSDGLVRRQWVSAGSVVRLAEENWVVRCMDGVNQGGSQVALQQVV